MRGGEGEDGDRHNGIGENDIDYEKGDDIPHDEFAGGYDSDAENRHDEDYDGGHNDEWEDGRDDCVGYYDEDDY